LKVVTAKYPLSIAFFQFHCQTTCAPNGSRYLLVGGTRQRHFAGTSFKPRKLLENAQTPTSRVHAVLGNHEPARTLAIKKAQSLTDKLAP